MKDKQLFKNFILIFFISLIFVMTVFILIYFFGNPKGAPGIGVFLLR